MAEAVSVLIIDDNPDDQLLYRRSLTKNADVRYEIIEAANGDDGLAQIAVRVPDCVLLDYSLPGRNGIEVLKRLRAEHPFVPVAMLTGQGNEKVAVAAMQEGAQDYVSKSSITADSLQRAINLSIEHCALQKRIHDQRTSLEQANRSLELEIGERRQAEIQAKAQLERLDLLHRITRAIGDRQDLDSIFKVVVRSLESQLPVEFGCICLFDAAKNVLTIAHVGLKNEALAGELARPENKAIYVGDNGFSLSLRGKFVHDPDITEASHPFLACLKQQGLRSVVFSPLQVESKVFGLLVAARNQPNGFNPGQCDFLSQLSEHVALAAHQAQLNSALQQAYDELRQTQQAVMQQERLRALGQMASGIAHDINNALSPVALYTQSLLETEQGLSSRAREYLETTQRAVEDIAHTVARLRDFYRQRGPQLDLSPVRLNELVTQATYLTRARWSDEPLQRGVVIELRTELATDDVSILGVESEIREALVNLILNAVDAMPEGGVLTVRTKLTNEQNESARTLQLQVSDTGIGMDEDTRKRCLEPFFTTKGERGTGLGLAMVYGIAQRHSATIDISSTLGYGTTISVIFPAATIHGRSKPHDATTALPHRLRLLLVDDDPTVLQAMRVALEVDGHLVTTANDGQAGISTFCSAVERGEAFAAVITDLGMPHIDGSKVASAVKTASPATPVILLTGWGQRILAEGNIPPHVDRVLSKPPRLRELRETLADVCPARLH
jgi:signal transduction histidine kinase/DNA-binding response OmpR family regulator